MLTPDEPNPPFTADQVSRLIPREGVCLDTYVAGYSSVLVCERTPGHDGDHRSYGGSEWA